MTHSAGLPRMASNSRSPDGNRVGFTHPQLIAAFRVDGANRDARSRVCVADFRILAKISVPPSAVETKQIPVVRSKIHPMHDRNRVSFASLLHPASILGSNPKRLPILVLGFLLSGGGRFRQRPVCHLGDV